jgi:hypothetical protein
MGAPTSSYATAGIVLRVSGALKLHHQIIIIIIIIIKVFLVLN